MKKIDIENKLSSSLESANLPSAHILDAVKQEIREEKTKKRTPINKYALVACVAVIICVLVSLPLVINAINLNKGNQEITYSSITEYAETIGINIVTFDELFNNENLNDGQIQGGADIDFGYIKKECRTIKDKESNILVQEVYYLDNNREITMTVYIDEYIDEEFADLNGNFVLNNYDVCYKYVDKKGYAQLLTNDYNANIKFEGFTEIEMIWYMQYFIMYQK